MVSKSVQSGGFDHTSVCTDEIGAMLKCFETKEWDTQECVPEINEMYGCVDLHKYDPVSGAFAALFSSNYEVEHVPSRRLSRCSINLQDPKELVGKWQRAMRQRVFTHFVKQKVLPRLK